MSEEKNVTKRYRVIVVHAPIQFIMDTDKVGEEMNKEVRERVVKLRAYPQDVMISELKEKPKDDEAKEEKDKEKND